MNNPYAQYQISPQMMFMQQQYQQQQRNGINMQGRNVPTFGQGGQSAFHAPNMSSSITNSSSQSILGKREHPSIQSQKEGKSSADQTAKSNKSDEDKQNKIILLKIFLVKL